MDVIAKRTGDRRAIPFKDKDLVTLSRFKALQAGLVAREDPADRIAYFDDFNSAIPNLLALTLTKTAYSTA